MNGRVIMMKAALGMAFALVLASCASPPKTVYKRLDGRSFSDPALRPQGEIDLATCRAVALNAGSQVYVPPPIQNRATNV
jgi:starvation-inducible outer membrane lipoprotein